MAFTAFYLHEALEGALENEPGIVDMLTHEMLRPRTVAIEHRFDDAMDWWTPPASWRRHESEFLMCFAFVAANTELSSTSPYFEVGFSPTTTSQEDERMFSLTVKAIVGIPFPMS